MFGDRVEFKLAHSQTSANKGRIYTSSGKGNSGFERSAMPFPEIIHKPKFKIDRASSFFTIGSCFAREIEIALKELNVNCITSRYTFPGDMYELVKSHETNGALNAYTPHSMLDLIRLPERPDARTVGMVQMGPDEYCDMLLSGLRFLTHDEANNARSTLTNVYQQLPKADVVVITLGFTEAWYDKESNIYVNRSPGSAVRLIRNHGDRFQFMNASPAAAVETVEAAVQQVARITNGRSKIILTTSPVPLHATFTARDSILGNSYSKSTLLSAAVYISTKYDFVDYFPSYEMVTNLPRSEAFLDDGVHVKRGVVQNIMSRFSELYF